jgi:hypothetical protein
VEPTSTYRNRPRDNDEDGDNEQDRAEGDSRAIPDDGENLMIQRDRVDDALILVR